MNIRIYLGTSLLVCISFFAGHAADDAHPTLTPQQLRHQEILHIQEDTHTCCVFLPCCCCCCGIGYLTLGHKPDTIMNAIASGSIESIKCCWDPVACCTPCQDTAPPCAGKWHEGGCNNLCVWKWLLQRRQKMQIAPGTHTANNHAPVVPTAPSSESMR